MTSRKQFYSGTCICGHRWDRHHLSMVNLKHMQETGEGSIASECLAYGFNELGGMMPNPDAHDTEEPWIDHCFGYVDTDDPRRVELTS